MKYIYHILIILILSGTTACGSWLDVQPKTSIEEKDLFSKEYGFKDALTGFYLKMGIKPLYTQDLSYYYLDMLAGRYESFSGVYDWSQLYTYDGTYQSTVNSIYSEMYNIIANINNFLRFVDVNRHVITTPDYYETMKGEALGLRAFLHFDLLRMFGPVYKNTPDGAAIPYRTKLNNEATPILSAKEVVALCLQDLLEAEKLLEGHDSEIFDYDDAADSFTEMRQMRMNLWAVRAMLARVYCYQGDAQSKELALRYATSVIDSEKFALSGYNDIAAAPILPKEQIFSLYVDEYYKVVNPVFVDAHVSGILCAYDVTTKDWYETVVDARYKTFRRVNSDNGYKSVCQKYLQNNYSSQRDTYSGLNSQPLIRLPEMYYIAAECEPDAKTAAGYLNTVIVTRNGKYNATTTVGFDQLDQRQIYGLQTGQTVRTNELMKEYLKEYYGEGQLFFFYKRFDFKTFSNCPLPDVRSKYQMPLPDDEYTFGNNQ